MKIKIHSKGFDLSTELEAYIHRRCLFAFSSFKVNIKEVEVYAYDESGLKKNLNKSCVVCVHLQNLSSVVESDAQNDFYATINRAIMRCKYTLSRQIKHHHILTMRSADDLSYEDARSA